MTDILAKVEKSSPMKDDYDTGHYNLALKDQLSLCFCQRFSLAARYVLIGLCDCHVKVDVILKHAALFFFLALKGEIVVGHDGRTFQRPLGHLTLVIRLRSVMQMWRAVDDECPQLILHTVSGRQIVVIRQGNFVGFIWRKYWFWGHRVAFFRQIMLTRLKCWWRFLRILWDSLEFFIK